MRHADTLQPIGSNLPYLPCLYVLFKRPPIRDYDKLARPDGTGYDLMASRLVGIRASGYPLLNQCITVKICSALLDILIFRRR